MAYKPKTNNQRKIVASLAAKGYTVEDIWWNNESGGYTVQIQPIPPQIASGGVLVGWPGLSETLEMIDTLPSAKEVTA